MKVVGDRLEVRHQSIHRALAGRRHRQSGALGVEPGQHATEGITQALAEEPQRQCDETDREVQQLRRAVKDAVLSLRRGERLPHRR
jgi:hypothetical protein